MAEKPSTLMPTSTAISDSSTKHVFLHEWWLVNAKGKGKGGGGGSLAVGGFAHRDNQRVSLFCSAPISMRLNSTMVLARDGIAVSLNGLINSRHTASNGFSSEVSDKFTLGFPYDWDDYAACNAHQGCGAQASVPHTARTEQNIYQSSWEDVPATSIRGMPKISDLNSLMDDILTKVGNPKEKGEPRCLKASPVIDRAGGCNHDRVCKADDYMVTPSRKELKTHCRWEEAVCSPNRTGISTRRSKRCHKASLDEDVAGYKHNLHNADVEVQTAMGKQQTHCGQLEAVNCHNQIANPASSQNTFPKASFCKDIAGEDQRDIECDVVTPSKKVRGYLPGEDVVDSCNRTSISPRSFKSHLRASVGQDVAAPSNPLGDTACDILSKKDQGCQPEEAVVDSCNRTSISPRSIKSHLRASGGQDVAEHKHNWSHNIDSTISSNKGQNGCLKRDSDVNSSSRIGVSTRSMTRLKQSRIQ